MGARGLRWEFIVVAPIAHSNVLCRNPASTAEVIKCPEVKAEEWLNGLGRE